MHAAPCHVRGDQLSDMYLATPPRPPCAPPSLSLCRVFKGKNMTIVQISDTYLGYTAATSVRIPSPFPHRVEGGD